MRTGPEYSALLRLATTVRGVRGVFFLFTVRIIPTIRITSRLIPFISGILRIMRNANPVVLRWFRRSWVDALLESPAVHKLGECRGQIFWRDVPQPSIDH